MTTQVEEINWNFCTPPKEYLNRTLTLLTIGRVKVDGVWSGGHGEFFVGWAPYFEPKNSPVKVANGPRR